MNHHTPVETYTVKGIPVDVKRDDLWAELPYPPNAKMRGIRLLLEQLASDGMHHIGVFDTRISEASWGAALEAKRLGMLCTAYYAQSKFSPRSLEHVLKAGGTVSWVRHNVTPVCYSVAKNHAEQAGIYMLPFGLSTRYAVDAVAKEVVETVPSRHYRSVVVCSGSCTMLAGLITGFSRLGEAPQFYSVSAGASHTTQLKSLKRWVDFVPPVAWIPAQIDYYEKCTYECPFPANEWYDRKAWRFLCEHINEIEQSTLFWNVGAS